MKKIITFCMFFLLANTCLAADGWNKLNIDNSGIGHISPHQFYFADSQKGWVAFTQRIWHTSDGGDNWIMQYTTNLNHNLQLMSFTDSLHGWVVSRYGQSLFKTTDGGNTWDSTYYLNMECRGTQSDIKFVDTLKGWSCGWFGCIGITTDGGENWINQDCPTEQHLRGLFFQDSLTGWIVGDSSTILKTTNGGSNWVNYGDSTSTINYEDVFFLDSLTGWIVGRDGTILKTTTGGNTWQEQTSGCSNLLHDVFFFNNNLGWIVGFDGTVLKTTNGGSNWNQLIYDNNTEKLRYVFFIDSLTGWLSGAFFYKTTTGGESTSDYKIGMQNNEILSVMNSSENIYLNYNIEYSSDVMIQLYNVQGVLIKSYTKGRLTSGKHTEILSTKNLSRGVYFIHLNLGGKRILSKKVLVFD